MEHNTGMSYMAYNEIVTSWFVYPSPKKLVLPPTRITVLQQVVENFVNLSSPEVAGR